MSDHYQVKFQRDGKTIFGIVEQYSDRAKKLAKEGAVIVSDAVLPVAYQVQEKDLIDIEMSSEYDHKRGCMKDEFSLYVADEFDKAKKLSASLKGLKPGKMFAVGVADGAAYYVVTEVGKKTCKVEWRGFCPDRWHCQILGAGGAFPVSAIKPQIQREETLNEIFGR